MTPQNELVVEHFIQAARVAEARGYPALPTKRRVLHLDRPRDDGTWNLLALLRFAAKAAGLAPEDIQSRSQVPEITAARQTFCWMGRHFGKRSFPEIASRINRDHTTVMAAVRKVQKVVDAAGVELPCSPTDAARDVLKLLRGHIVNAAAELQP